MEAADEGAGAGFGEVVGGLVGGGNVGKADGAVADRLLAQPMNMRNVERMHSRVHLKMRLVSMVVKLGD